MSSASAYKPVVIANGWSPSDVDRCAARCVAGRQCAVREHNQLGRYPTVDALEQLKPSEVVLVGGTAALSADIVTELDEVVPDVPVTRLAGDDRIHTAALAALHTLGSATPVVTDTGAQAEASTGPGNAQDYRNGYSETRFRVGTDLLPGVWQVKAFSIAEDSRKSQKCWHRDDQGNWVNKAISINDEKQVLHTSIPNPAVRFGLLEGDIVTLQASAGDICSIVRVSD